MIFTPYKRPKLFIVGSDFITDYQYVKAVLDEFFGFLYLTAADIYTYDKAIGVCYDVIKYAKFRGWNFKQIRVGRNSENERIRTHEKYDYILVIPPYEVEDCGLLMTKYPDIKYYEAVHMSEGYRFDKQ